MHVVKLFTTRKRPTIAHCADAYCRLKEPRLSKSALRSFIMSRPLLLRAREEIMDPEMETILHPSPLRLKWLGIFTLVGNPLFWYVWKKLLQQPYESLPFRVLLACLGVGLFFQGTKHGMSSALTRRYFSILCWLQIPVFFTLM
jgi:two-component system, CAI-1 autoinducer sensor kinase/phosphatase CqsS